MKASYALGNDRYTQAEYPATVIERNGVSYHRIEIGAGFGGNMVAYQRADGSDATMASNKPFTLPPIPHHAGVVDTQPEAPEAVEIPVTVDAPLSAGTWENVVEIPLMMKADIEAGNAQRATCEYYEGVIAEMQATIDKLRDERKELRRTFVSHAIKRNTIIKKLRDDVTKQQTTKALAQPSPFSDILTRAEAEPPKPTGHKTYDAWMLEMWESGKSPYVAQLALYEQDSDVFFDGLREMVRKDNAGIFDKLRDMFTQDHQDSATDDNNVIEIKVNKE